MSIKCEILNGICRLMYGGEYRKFCAPCNIKKAQFGYLADLLRKNADTEYGGKYGFGNIKSYREFAEKVPLTVYEDYEPYIEKIANGGKRVLTAEDVLLFELTSGSSGGKKLIPCTRSLKAEFQRGIKPWIYDIYSKVEGVCSGKSYWSITPVTAKKSFTHAGIPIGFEEDSEYFGAAAQAVMKHIFAVGSDVKFSSDMRDFYLKTSRELIACSELTLISVWNPAFLTILCGFIAENAEILGKGLPSDRKRRLMAAVRKNNFSLLFPNLKIISCWADGSAADCIDEVRRRFPGVYIQPKGLLATECFVSFPLVGEEGGRLGIYSHFFEFMSLANGRIYPAHALKKGEYELIVTTGGGFYRYRIGDIVQILETYPDRPPRLRFLRRRGVASDLFGEKLTEEFVRGVCTALGINGVFCLLAPEGSQYLLYTAADNIDDDTLDRALRDSFHYDYCRSLGQLKKARVVNVCGDPMGDYIKRLTDDGMRIGDIKPAYLSRKSGWDKYFSEK